MKNVIQLGAREMMQGAFVGMMRQIENLSRRRDDAHCARPTDGWQLHVEGALGEMAFAKYLGIFWSGAHEFRGRDVGGYEVRTRSRHDYDLIVHRNDADGAKFVLLTGINGRYIVRGWILGSDAKREEWWADPAGGRPAFFVPQSALKDLRR